MARSPLMPNSIAAGRAESSAPAGPPRLRRIAAVVNPAAGSVGPGAAEALAEIVAQHGFQLDLATPQPDGIEAAMRALSH